MRLLLNSLKQAREEFEKGNLRQASEKIWSACALAVKAYAYWKEKKQLTSHRELWKYKDIVAKDLGDWVRATFRQANLMHINFHEGWATREDVEDSLREVEKLVETIAKVLEKT